MTRLPFMALLVLLGPLAEASTDERLAVVVSVPPQQWLVERVGGEHVDVEVLVAPGESPTTYQPTDAQVTQLMRSRLFFCMGVPFERGSWFDAVRQMGRYRVVDMRRGIELLGDDPHIWLSPRLLEIQAATVAEALAQLDPDRRPVYEENLARLKRQLQDLDSRLRTTLDRYAGRSFLVFHPSWGYFADDYRLRQVAIERGGREPSDRELTELQQLAREARITAVFVQPQIHGRGARAFAESIGARVEILDPLAADVAVNLAATAAKLATSFAEATPDD
jgi:zinc transport system substrate-binding protein